VRNLIIRLSITYIVLLGVSALPGIQFREPLYDLWTTSIVFVVLTKFARPVLLALTLPLTIRTAGLFIFVIDGGLLLLTGLFTGLEVAGFGWAVLGTIVISEMNIWVEEGFKRLGWLEREGEARPDQARSPGWLLRLLLSLGLLFGIVFGALMAFQVTLTLSIVTANLAVLAAAALLTLLLVTLEMSWLVADGLEAEHRARFSGIVATLTTAAGVAALAYVWLGPVEVPAPPPADDVTYWDLATGSHIAYIHFPASGGRSAPPLVYLHDGPGLAVLEAERRFYSRFADDGFDVYLYDQVGTGRSGRLDDIAQYSMERNIADLDAIRAELGVGEMVLVGQGAGAELAARYLSRFPERVYKAVFHSPTPLWDKGQFFLNYARTASPSGPNVVLEPRLLLAASLATHGPRAAQNLVSQGEMGALLERSFNPRSWVCARHGHAAPRVEHGGFNAYVQLRTELTARAMPDPRPRLVANLTPTLVLAAECDYLPWEVILQYRDALLNEQVFYFEGAGHMIQLTQPEPLTQVIRAFLLDEPYPMLPYAGEANPRPTIGP